MLCVFFFNDTATTEIYTLSLHDALPIYTLVVDEAHHLEDQATAQFTVTLSERQLTEFADAVAGSDGVALAGVAAGARSEEHTSEIQSRQYLVFRLLL